MDLIYNKSNGVWASFVPRRPSNGPRRNYVFHLCVGVCVRRWAESFPSAACRQLVVVEDCRCGWFAFARGRRLTLAHSVTFAALCEFIVANSSLFRRLPAIFETVLSLLFCYVAPGARITSGASTPLTGGSTMLPGKSWGSNFFCFIFTVVKYLALNKRTRGPNLP